MKKITLIAMLLAIVWTLRSENSGVTLTFTANYQCEYKTLDSVLIENLTQPGKIVLFYPDTAATFLFTGTDMIQNTLNKLNVSQNFPNPFADKTHIDVYVPSADQLQLSVYDIRGALVASYQGLVEQGAHQFAFSASGRQVYVLIVTSTRHARQILMLQTGKSTGLEASLTYHGVKTIQKEDGPAIQTKAAQNFVYNLGDQLRFTGYIANVDNEVETFEITDTPAADTDYLFDIANHEPDIPSVITGPEMVCNGDAHVEFSVEFVQDVSYIWSLPEGWSILEGQGSHSINALTGDSGPLKVTAKNMCGTSQQRAFNVLVQTPTVALAGPDQIYNDGTTSIALAANEPEDGHWTGTWSIISGEGGSFDNATNPITTFSGVLYTMYELQWTITTNCNVSNDNLTIWFGLDGGEGNGVFDIDGNFYPSAFIANQEWMTENLRVTRYCNGDAIPTGLNNIDWYNTTDGVYAIYNNDYAMLEAYGALYNWYAVDDARSLCPTGWHVPTYDEWTKLLEYVIAKGYPNNNVVNGAGNALKSCRQLGHPYGGDCATSEHPLWYSNSTHYGTDAFVFSALPGGSRWFNGSFYGVGSEGSWWSSTEIAATTARYQQLHNSAGSVNRHYLNKSYGLSVRCLRDLETTNHTLNINITPEGSGVVTGAGSYNVGTEVSITATPSDGYAFVSWTGDIDQIADASASNTTVTMPAQDIMLIANFNWLQETITEIVDVLNPATGKTWMDRNLGASRAATSRADPEAYGDLYQWGRDDDGHQKRTSGTTTILSSSDSPGHGNFILSSNSPYDWRNPQNTDLWQGANGTNNPCPVGYRLPTHAEWLVERQSWSSSNYDGAFASPLKLPLAGARGHSFSHVGSLGYYWSSTVSSTNAQFLEINFAGSGTHSSNRGSGMSVRCLKD
jgi:uncharacterized protein (TIGR02145 family)